MAVRAKFKVNKIERQNYSRAIRQENGNYTSQEEEMQTIVLAPVYRNGDPEHENTKFWNASPAGEIRLGTINAAAAAYFELGAEYYIDFTRAE